MFWKLISTIAMTCLLIIFGSMPIDMAIALDNPIGLMEYAWIILVVCAWLAILKLIWTTEW